MTETQTQEPDVQLVNVPVPSAELTEVAKKLLKAAGDRPEQVRTITGGFRVTYALAKSARVLGYVAQEDEDAPTAPAAPAAPAEQPDAPADDADSAPADGAPAADEDDDEPAKAAKAKTAAAKAKAAADTAGASA